MQRHAKQGSTRRQTGGAHPRSIWRLWQKQAALKSTRAVPGRRRNLRVAASTANTDWHAGSREERVVGDGANQPRQVCGGGRARCQGASQLHLRKGVFGCSAAHVEVLYQRLGLARLEVDAAGEVRSLLQEGGVAAPQLARINHDGAPLRWGGTTGAGGSSHKQRTLLPETQRAHRAFEQKALTIMPRRTWAEKIAFMTAMY